jgi:hypothetical protein
MTSPAFRPGLSQAGEPLPIRHLLFPLVTVIVAGVFVLAFVHPSLIRPVLLIALIPLVAGVGLLAPSTLIYVLAVWLVALGLVRRLVDTTAPSSLGGLGDPLLLVEPAVMIILLAVASQKGAFRHRTRLANAVLVLTVLAAVEIVNPLQGSPLVGIGGALFVLVPILAFWVGRALVDEQILRRLFQLVAVLALAAVAYGLFQQLRGLPSWDSAWVQTSGYAALNVGGVIRPFGTFSSAAEYATFLGIGLVIWAATFTKRAVFLVALAAACLLGYGIFYESSRGIVVLGVGALALMLAARLGLRPAFALAAGLLGLLALSFVAGHFASSSSAPAASNPGAALVQHQVQGLANPFSSQDSTLSGHFSEMVDGFRSALTVPVGHGTGSVTIAASRYGGSVKGTEVDPSNVGVALGLPGLAAYLVVVVVGLLKLYRTAAITRTWWTLAALGVVIATFLQWTNGGQYAVAWLPWLVLGWVDRTRNVDMSIVHANVPESFCES